LAPSGAGLLKVKVFWRQKARVVLRLKISGMIKYLEIGLKGVVGGNGIHVAGGKPG